MVWSSENQRVVLFPNEIVPFLGDIQHSLVFRGDRYDMKGRVTIRGLETLH